MTPSLPSTPSLSALGARAAGLAAVRLERARAWATASGLTPMINRAGLVLLMLAAGALLFRPADLIPALAGAPIYEVLIVACLVVSLPRVLGQLTARSLREN